MKKSLAFLWGAGLLVGLTVTGCHKDDTTAPDASSSQQAPTGVSDEQSAMKYFSLNDEFVSNDETAFADQKIAPTDYDENTSKVDGAITPLRWGRFITSITRTVTVTSQPGDSITVATVNRTIIGVLKIKASSASNDTSTIMKNFQDKSVREVVFRRLAHDPKRFWLNWVPVATTLVSGGTDPAPADNEIHVTKVQLTTSSDTLTITDPMATWLRYRWLKMFNGGKADVPTLQVGDNLTVNVTIQSQSPDTDLVALRHGFGLKSAHYKRTRMALVSQSGPDANGFYTKVYQKQTTVHVFPGYFNVGVDALTHATLYDDAAPYSVSWWGVPYRVF